MKKLFVLVLALTFVLVSAVSLMANGAASDDAVWPDGTPTVYVGYGAGGGTDTAVRPMIAEMAKYLGENINVVNMPGANSSVACDYVLAEKHDGYTMFATGTGGFASYPVYGYSKSGWQDWISFHPYSGPAVIFANAESGIETTDDLFDYLADGGIFSIGAFGNGPHTQFEAICAAKGADSPNYALFGSCNDAGVAVIAGEAMVGAGSMSSVIDYINAGKLVPIFVTCADPFKFANVDITAPSVTTEVAGTDSIPNLNETWPIMIPRDTPKEIVDALTSAFEYALKTDSIKEFAASKGFNIIGLKDEAADEFLAYSISGYSWTIYNAGLADGNPADSGIPTLAEFDWKTLKKTIE